MRITPGEVLDHAAFRQLATQLRDFADGYAALGLTSDQAAGWANHGFTPDEAADWIAEGHTPERASHWSGISVMCGKPDCSPLGDRHPVSPAEARRRDQP